MHPDAREARPRKTGAKSRIQCRSTLHLLYPFKGVRNPRNAAQVPEGAGEKNRNSTWRAETEGVRGASRELWCECACGGRRRRLREAPQLTAPALETSQPPISRQFY